MLDCELGDMPWAFENDYTCISVYVYMNVYIYTAYVYIHIYTPKSLIDFPDPSNKSIFVCITFHI